MTDSKIIHLALFINIAIVKIINLNKKHEKMIWRFKNLLNKEIKQAKEKNEKKLSTFWIVFKIGAFKRYFLKVQILCKIKSIISQN